MQHIHVGLPSLLSSLTLAGSAVALLALSSACASNERDEVVPWDTETVTDAQASFPAADAALAESPVSPGVSTSPQGTPSGASTSTARSSDSGAGAPSGSSAASTPSAGGDIDGLIGDLFSGTDGGAKPTSSDGGTGGDWQLEPDSDEACPPEPPPIPIVGGACLGLYYTCNWRNAAGDTYLCTCDWVHWLCI